MENYIEKLIKETGVYIDTLSNSTNASSVLSYLFNTNIINTQDLFDIQEECEINLGILCQKK